jgi:hypothetical protein
VSIRSISPGFSGAAQLTIGVLAKRSIVRFHYRDAAVGGSYRIGNDLRHDLKEVGRG